MAAFELTPNEKDAAPRRVFNKAFLEAAPQLTEDQIGFLARAIAQVEAGELDVDDTLLATLDSLIPGAEEAIRAIAQQLSPDNPHWQFDQEQFILDTIGRIRSS